MQTIALLAITLSSLSILVSATGTIIDADCTVTSGPIAAISGTCCPGVQTTDAAGGAACCVGGSFSLSRQPGFPQSGSLISVPVGTCRSIVPITAADYSSIVFGSGVPAAASASATSGVGTSSSTAAAAAVITEKPVLAIAGLAAAGMVALL